MYPYPQKKTYSSAPDCWQNAIRDIGCSLLSPVLSSEEEDENPSALTCFSRGEGPHLARIFGRTSRTA
jgi:hypothetical protein